MPTVQKITAIYQCSTGFINKGSLSYDRNQRNRAKLWDEITDYPFENITVKGFKNYDEYLSKKYGDYMKMPPIEEQKSLHTFKAYLK